MRETKQDQREAEEKDHEVRTLLKRTEWRLEQQANDFMSLENFVEKYIPLKVQHQIMTSVKPFLSESRQRKFQQLCSDQSGAMRTAVMKDLGVPRLQERCLQLITDMRLELDLMKEKEERIKMAQRSKTTKLQKDRTIVMPVESTFEEEDAKRVRFSPTGRSGVEKKIRKKLGYKTADLQLGGQPARDREQGGKL